jgi:hypothetical protein
MGGAFCNCLLASIDPVNNYDELRKIMPRLVGKQSNKGLYVGLFLLVAIAGFIGLEYSGTMNVIPGFGKESILINRQKQL